jgi:hypothetical protein
MTDAETISSPSIRRKRPKLVWVITVFYVISAGWTLLSFALIYSGITPLNAAQVAYFKSQTILDTFFTIVIGALNFIGTIFLFFLTRTAFHLFLSAFILSILMTAYHILSKNWLAAIGGPGLIGAIIGWAISGAVILYTRRLIKHDILN